jgi:signal peptidase I
MVPPHDEKPTAGLGSAVSPDATPAGALQTEDAAQHVEPRRRGVRIGVLIRDVVEAVVLAVVLFWVLQIFVQNTVVEGSSMAPGFVNGQRLLVNKLAFRSSGPERGDVVVFHPPGREDKDFIKRVIALPGEAVAIQGGRVLIGGEPLEEPWAPVRATADSPPFVVPDGQFFVLGDNRPFSNDSRAWGEALRRERIVGKAWLSVWPPSTWGLIRSDRPGPASQSAGG